jgi:2-phospho-L-lactate/phosphoenolpyruvate guanylyltransferase
MKFALLPVKARAHAKQRLGEFLSPREREALARVMYEEVFEKLTAARGIDRVVVVTSDASAARHARRAGALVFAEREQRGHSHSADRAARRAMELGASTVLLLPIDVPLVTSAEIEGLAEAARPGVIIVPSADGTGTNALVRTPPDVIECRFGKDSLRAHLEQARLKGVAAEIMRPPGIVFDIDTPADVAELLARAPNSRTAALLRGRRPRWASAS